MSLSFRCYAYARGGLWRAVCVDLDISVDGPSFRDVEESLIVAIQLYLEKLSELPDEERSRLLARRAPWRVRFGLAMLTRLGGLFGAGDRSRGFVFRSGAPAFS